MQDFLRRSAHISNLGGDVLVAAAVQAMASKRRTNGTAIMVYMDGSYIHANHSSKRL